MVLFQLVYCHMFLNGPTIFVTVTLLSDTRDEYVNEDDEEDLDVNESLAYTASPRPNIQFSPIVREPPR